MSDINITAPTFIPVRGAEQTILNQRPQEGLIYFSTDSGKMYMDDYDNATGELVHKPIGGTGASLLYSKFTEDESQGRPQPDGTYRLTKNDLELPDSAVNVDDLIINIDGKFLRVSEFNIDGSFNCAVIAVSGTGGGGGGSGGGGDTSYGTAYITSISPQSFNYRYGDKVSIKFNFVSKRSTGETSGSAPATLHINNGVAVANIEVNQGDNEIDITKYLGVGRQRLTIRVQADVGAAQLMTITYTWTIIATQLTLKWDYNIAKRNEAGQPFNLSWQVAGDEVDKTSHLIIRDAGGNECLNETILSTANSATISRDFAGLSHGVYTAELYMSALIGVQTLTTETIKYQLMFVDSENVLPLVVYNLDNDQMQQYDTKTIQYAIYSKAAEGLGTEVSIRENDVTVDTITKVFNNTPYSWNYSPVNYGTQKITFVCGSTEVSFRIEVAEIDLGDTEEVNGYAFKLKATEIGSNIALQNWKAELTGSEFNNWSNKEVGLTFSDNFDWTNGGIKSEELMDGTKRTFIRVRAGTTMDINYDLFQMGNLTALDRGKCFKFIFRATNCRDYNAQVLSCFGQNMGLIMRAQDATLTLGSETLTTSYCEDSYIEFEYDVWPQTGETGSTGRRYIMMWIDGIPVGIKVYNIDATLSKPGAFTPITIGSLDCDVDVYLVKAYEKHIDDIGHLNNFIMDAYNADEMMKRFIRNDILVNGEISYTKLVEKNPKIQAYCYEIPRMTKNKSDKVSGVTFALYEGSSAAPKVTATGAQLKVQGTSSAFYGVAALNFDAEYKEGFVYANNTKSAYYQLNPNSYPVNYFCTKVNVASSEGANNALNQDWYNTYQPWHCRLRRKDWGDNYNRRDTMEFKPGIVFMKDFNKQGRYNGTTEVAYDSRNLFEDTEGYIDNPYFKMYSIGNMGNSKKNIELLHDESNPYEICIENADNQQRGQWMTAPQGLYQTRDAATGKMVNVYVDLDPTKTLDETITITYINANQQEQTVTKTYRELWLASMDGGLYEPRYPDGFEDLAKRYGVKNSDGEYNTSDEAWNSSRKKDYQDKIDILLAEDTNVLPGEGSIPALLSYEANPIEEFKKPITEMNPYNAAVEGWWRFVSWLARNDPNKQSADHPNGWDGKELDEPVVYGPVILASDGVKGYYNGSLGGITISDYASDEPYTHDTHEYRMAKMLHECQDYLALESVVFHYLFIERHSMIDNVAKNTFWSTEDGKHWNLVKNYDNDTADGNNNEGHLALKYGIECLDPKNKENLDEGYYFNAHQSVWLNFIDGLDTLRTSLYQTCYNGNSGINEDDPRNDNVWNAQTYLNKFTEWQSGIPERCWIEDYYRKYRRPRELGLDSNGEYVKKLEGGNKTHQRRQYETYQQNYCNSEYNAEGFSGGTNFITLRTMGKQSLQDGLKVTLYADGYIMAEIGQVATIPLRGERGKEYTIRAVNEQNLNDATFYIANANNISTFKNIGLVKPVSIEYNSANKLREIEINSGSEPNANLTKVGFANSTLLEKIWVENCPNAVTGLNLTELKNLREIYTEGSGFTSVVFADGGLLEKAQLNAIEELTLRNVRTLAANNGLTLENYTKLNKIDIENSNIDSYLLVSKVQEAQEAATDPIILKYRIQGADWLVNDSAAINEANKTINILEFLSNPEKAIPIDASYDKTTILNKSFTFDDNVITSDPASYYYKYVNKQAFPGLDIVFDSNPMPKISIYDTSDQLMWERRIGSGEEITESYLLDPAAPMEFKYPQSTDGPTQTYTFTGNWLIYDAANLETEPEIIEGSTETVDSELKYPLGYIVTKDIIIKPEVQITPRQFEVFFYQTPVDGVYTPIAEYTNENRVPYNTVLSTILPSPNPVSPLPEPEETYYTWRFKGWAAKGYPEILVDPSAIRVTSNELKYEAVYEKAHVYNTPTDPNNFTIELGLIRLKRPGVYKGKIVVPKVVEGQVVTGLNVGCFQHGYYGDDLLDTSGITHIFFEPLAVNEDGSNPQRNTNITSFGHLCFAFAGSVSGLFLEIPPNYQNDNNIQSFLLSHINEIYIDPSKTNWSDYFMNSAPELRYIVNLGDFKDTLISIGNGAFQGCNKLEWKDSNDNLLTFADFNKLETIGTRAFYDCQRLNLKYDESQEVILGQNDKIYFGEKLQLLGTQAFERAYTGAYKVYLSSPKLIYGLNPFGSEDSSGHCAEVNYEVSDDAQVSLTYNKPNDNYVSSYLEYPAANGIGNDYITPFALRAGHPKEANIEALRVTTNNESSLRKFREFYSSQFETIHLLPYSSNLKEDNKDWTPQGVATNVWFNIEPFVPAYYENGIETTV